MENIKLNIEKTLDFISKEKLASYEPKVKACMETLEKGTGLGNDFLGWLHFAIVYNSRTFGLNLKLLPRFCATTVK